MNSRDTYQSWLEARRSVGVSDGFQNAVMKRVSALGRGRRAPGALHRWLEWVSVRPLIQAAILAAALLLGAARMVATLQIVLSN